MIYFVNMQLMLKFLFIAKSTNTQLPSNLVHFFAVFWAKHYELGRRIQQTPKHPKNMALGNVGGGMLG
jgi:hypothetical protein